VICFDNDVTPVPDGLAASVVFVILIFSMAAVFDIYASNAGGAPMLLLGVGVPAG
jgi:hypothetical protein